MKPGIVAGNWKMHGSRAFVEDYVSALGGGAAGLGASLVLIPPVGYLALLRDCLERAGLSGIVSLGAQNLHAEARGAFTGEMSAEMLQDLGAEWVLVGHSERREQAAESNEDVAAKVAAARRAGLRPVLCVGETEAERESGRAGDVVVEQIRSVIDRAGVEALAAGALAYEPVWAIGTGRTATPVLAQEMHGLIRETLRAESTDAAATPILYGGSVKSGNARALFAEQDIDGGLVGGASLEADELIAIARCLEG